MSLELICRTFNISSLGAVIDAVLSRAYVSVS